MSSNLKIPDPPVGWIGHALLDLEATLAKKNEDYKIDGEFSNFKYAADIVGGGMTPDMVMLTQIAIKLGRLHGLPDTPLNESRLDTYKDLAGYAVILYAYATSVNHKVPTEATPCGCSNIYICQAHAVMKVYGEKSSREAASGPPHSENREV